MTDEAETVAQLAIQPAKRRIQCWASASAKADSQYAVGQSQHGLVPKNTFIL
jgi:hypothetical protein